MNSALGRTGRALELLCSLQAGPIRKVLPESMNAVGIWSHGGWTLFCRWFSERETAQITSMANTLPKLILKALSIFWEILVQHKLKYFKCVVWSPLVHYQCYEKTFICFQNISILPWRRPCDNCTCIPYFPVPLLLINLFSHYVFTEYKYFWKWSHMIFDIYICLLSLSIFLRFMYLLFYVVEYSLYGYTT